MPVTQAVGEPRRALDFLMIAVHMAPRHQDAERWRRLAQLSAALGFRRQAVYCWSKARLLL